jgi:hypothetical protein
VLAADDTVARLREATGHDITVQPLQLDPSDPDSIKAGVAKLRESRDGKVRLNDPCCTPQDVLAMQLHESGVL